MMRLDLVSSLIFILLAALGPVSSRDASEGMNTLATRFCEEL